MHIIGVKFKTEGKIYNFASEIKYEKGDKIIVETDRGLQLGEVTEIDKENNPKNLKEIIRKADDKDYTQYLNNIKDAKKAVLETKELIKKIGLNMNLIDASYSLDKKMLLFNFVSDERVDFRDLVKELAARYRTRIELHQVGVRDKAKEVGGLGLCGRILCCNGCLRNVNSVNITMVKNQNIALNPTKINGACGRLLCCFTYENELYEENRKKLPKIGEKMKYKGKEVEVTDLDIINLGYTVNLGDNTYERVKID